MPLACGAGAATLLLCAVVAFASHATQKACLLRRRLEAVTDDAGRLLQERARIAEESTREQTRLTEEFERERVRRAEQFAQEKTCLSAELTQERSRLGAENARLAEELRRTRTEGGAAVSAAANAAGPCLRLPLWRRAGRVRRRGCGCSRQSQGQGMGAYP